MSTSCGMMLRPVTQLVQELRERKKRHADYYVPYSKLRAAVVEHQEPAWGEHGAALTPTYSLGVSLDGRKPRAILPNVFPQLALRTDAEGKRQVVPATYLRDLADLRGNRNAVQLAADNVNFWLERVGAPARKGGALKQHFVRMVADCAVRDDNDKPLDVDADFMVRALLSESYRPIDHLDMLVTALQVVTGRYEFTDGGQNHAAGAQVLEWRLTEAFMDVLFLNTTIAFDLKHPERGLIDCAPANRGGNVGDHEFLRPQLDETAGTHFVFPAARISNSETGNGSIQVVNGLFQRWCTNRMFLGEELRRRHIGAVLDDDASIETRRKSDALVFSQIADKLRIVFDRDSFLAECRRFAGLFDIRLTEVKPAFDAVCKVGGLSASMIDELLTLFTPLRPGVNTLGDVQCAITRAAHTGNKTPELQRELEDFGGKIISMGAKALGAARSDLVLA